MKTKIINGKSYKVVAPTLGHGLDIGFVVTAEAAVARTLESNKRAVAKGYSAEKWLVVEKTWQRVFDKNLEFLRESEHTEVVAVVNEDNTVEYR